MKSITKYNIIRSLVSILVIALFWGYAIFHYNMHETQLERRKLDESIKTFWQLLDAKGTNFRVVDGKLLAGDYRINGNFELPDKIQEIFGGVATIFMGDERVSTNVLNAEGKRAVGTKLVGPAHEAVFKQGMPYRGEARILGVNYLTAYDPIRDSTGKIIGVLFVGSKKSELLSSLYELQLHLTLILAIVVVVFLGSMVLLGRSLRRVEEANANQILFMQTLLDTIPTPIFYKDLDCRYLGCNKAFEAYVGFSQEELIGKTPHQLWPSDLADSYRQQDLALLGNPGMQVYEAAVRYADGSQREVIFNKATFKGRAGNVAGLVGVIVDITERKRAEDALAFQNVLLSAQQEASIDGILVVDENARILSFNRRFVEVWGVPTELIDADEDEPVLAYNASQTADPERFLEKVRYLYEHKEETSRDEIPLVDGRTLDRYSVPLLGPDGHYYGRLWSFRDITERKQTEDKIRSAYQQLQDIINFLPDATFVIDKQKRVIAWNRAIEKLTGLSREEVIGKGDYIYSTPFYNERRPILIDLIDEDVEVVKNKYSYIHIEGRTLFAETYIPAFRNGNDCYLWGTATPLFDSQGNHTGAIESIRDISDYKLAEADKVRLEMQLDHARLMQTFIARLGHDLRTPLTPLFIMLPLIRKQFSDPALVRKVDMCIICAETIKHLSDKARTLKMLSFQVNPHEMEVVSLAALVDQACDGHAKSISHKRLSCRNTVEPAIVVHVIPAQFVELFSQLIVNAIQFSPDKGAIIISAERSDKSLQISVKDEGVGLESSHIDHIFDEFFKADESRHDLGANGLGLTICKRIVQNHHGRIWAESAGIGTGTTIRISLNEQNIQCIQ